MEIAVIVLLLLAGAMIYNHMYRKKMYREIDRLEAWKIALMNRPVTDELSKVKQLNMTGETEQLFERWRQKWDDIVAVQLPDVEEKLFDAETMLDKYRYTKARELLHEINQLLRQIEEEVQLMINEVNELIGSEEQNRVEIEELRTMYREAKKMLLAYRYTFGIAAAKLDEKLEEAETLFKKFEELTETGNYLAAREVVLSLKKELSEITVMMDDIPELLAECQTAIPAQLEELFDGYKEMEQEGYILDHLQMEKEIKEKREKIEQYVQMIGDLRIEEAKQGIAELKEEIDTLYDLLENEVLSHQYIKTEVPRIEEMLVAREKLEEMKKKLSEALRLVQKSRLPGLPESYTMQLSEAKDHLTKVALRLEEKPLNMPAVNEALEEAKTIVQRVYERTEEMIEQASLVERVIQYGNRYRRRYPAVKEGLEEAEFLFRHYDYEQALEQAVATIEKVEPGAFQRVQQMFQEDRSNEK
ncbi:septation ring formation regulator EzrA [Saccharococcus thermophilus]|nr:septation ring formation regulator EzrA [Saccharococcus thermophilus]